MVLIVTCFQLFNYSTVGVCSNIFIKFPLFLDFVPVFLEVLFVFVKVSNKLEQNDPCYVNRL